MITLAAFSVLALLPWSALAAQRFHGNVAPAPSIPKIDVPLDFVPTSVTNGTALPPYDTWYYFDQLIDHNNPKLGTFKQRYYFTYEFYKPGGPIVLCTPGEGNADGYYGYITNRTINGLIAQSNNGAAVLIEHRFFGLSNPYPDLSETSFRVHTLEQAVQDLVYFAQTAVLPMPGGGSVGSPKAPWILVGGSYSGALTSWVMHSHPGVFWAGYASSAVVQAIEYLWGYFEPIRQNMAKNCSADVEAVITHMDHVFTSGTKSQQQDLKIQFGMGNVTHLDDVAGALRNPIWEWQSLSPTTPTNSTFWKFCDALEVKDGVSAPASGWGLQHALVKYGAFLKSYLEADSFCGGPVTDECVGTYDKTLAYWTDTAIDNASRSWLWFCCQYFGYWQDGAPLNWPTLVTRLVGPAYDNRQCSYWFPKTFPTITSAKPNTAYINSHYGGWDINTPRLFFANGYRDPWKECTVSSDFHTRQSTDLQPIRISDGFHCSDLSVKNAVADPTVAAVQADAVAYFKTWVSQFKPGKITKRDGSATLPADIIAAGPAGLVPNNEAESGSNAGTGAKHVFQSGWGKKVIKV